MRGTILAGALVLLAPTADVSAQRPSRLTAVIQEPISIGLPLASCAVASVVAAVARRVATAVGEPSGTELVPESCPRSGPRQTPSAEHLMFMGMTLREALDRLVELDPRYRWVESDGVIVMRPVDAWNDREHFLHRTVASFEVKGEPLTGALAAIQNALAPFQVPESTPGPTPDAQRPISLALGATSILEALNATVRAHGALQWSVSYCQPQARYENATIGLFTFDGSGTGSHPVFLRDQNGRSYDPCQNRPRGW